MTSLVTAWPTGQHLVEWVGGAGALTDTSLVLADDLVADATAIILDRVDPDKLPATSTDCPRQVARAIILEAARLLSRRESSHGLVSFGDFAARLANVDVDIEACLRHWRTDPEP